MEKVCAICALKLIYVHISAWFVLYVMDEMLEMHCESHQLNVVYSVVVANGWCGGGGLLKGHINGGGRVGYAIYRHQ